MVEIVVQVVVALCGSGRFDTPAPNLKPLKCIQMSVLCFVSPLIFYRPPWAGDECSALTCQMATHSLVSLF